nr:hypothetical protein [Tanacetum cinerariifolium]
MHNNIMVAGFRDRPLMLAPGRYPQWHSLFLRYVDTRPNNKALRKCILSDPYKPTTVLVHVVEATDNSPAVAEHTTVETPANMAAAVVLAVGDRRSPKKWRQCMASVGGGLDRSGDWKYFWVRQKNSPEKLSGDGRGGGRRRPVGGRQRLPKCGREKWE